MVPDKARRILTLDAYQSEDHMTGIDYGFLKLVEHDASSDELSGQYFTVICTLPPPLSTNFPTSKPSFQTNNSESQLCTSASSLTSPIQKAVDLSTFRGPISHVTA